jgi:hypothetical protein
MPWGFQLFLGVSSDVQKQSRKTSSSKRDVNDALEALLLAAYSAALT